MKKKIKQSLPYIIILMVSLILCIPLFSMNLSDFNEFRIHIGRIASVKQIIKDGVFPALISYKHMNDFGYALNIFYGPITTYLPILISLVVGSTIIALKIFTLFTVAISGIAMYNFVFYVTKNKYASIISSLIYIVAPYKLTDIYSRNAVGEYTAFIFIPLLFDGLYRYVHDDKKYHTLIILGAVGLILSHTITTIYTAIFAFIYLIINYKNVLKKYKISKIFLDLVIIILLCLFYIIPLLECKLSANYTIFSADRMNSYGSDVYEATIGIKEIFGNEFDTKNELITSLGFASIVLTLASLLCFKEVNKQYKGLYIISLIFSIISIFMCTKLFPWFIMPQGLTIIQFAWRMLGFFIFFDSIICGINAMIITQKLKKPTNQKIAMAIIAIPIILGGVLRVSNYVSTYDAKIDNTFEQNIYLAEKIGPYQINRDYMPLRAIQNIDYLKNRSDRTYLLSGEATITSEVKEKLDDKIIIKDTNNAILELPYLYYPGYTVMINDKEISTFESQNGFVAIKTNEEGTIHIKYTGTMLDKIAYLISIATSCIILILLLYKNINNCCN